VRDTRHTDTARPMNDTTRFDRNANIVLVGMPGAGKSTVGIILAKLAARNFVDTDVLIQIREQCTLQDIVDSEGHMSLRATEERAILDLHCERHVIATGGSAAYSPAAMEHLRSNGIVVFLDVPFKMVEMRISNLATRGIARRADQTLRDLFDERHPLYVKYADVHIECGALAQEPLAELLCRRLGREFPALGLGGASVERREHV